MKRKVMPSRTPLLSSPFLIEAQPLHVFLIYFGKVWLMFLHKCHLLGFRFIIGRARILKLEPFPSTSAFWSKCAKNCLFLLNEPARYALPEIRFLRIQIK